MSSLFHIWMPAAQIWSPLLREHKLGFHQEEDHHYFGEDEEDDHQLTWSPTSCDKQTWRWESPCNKEIRKRQWMKVKREEGKTCNLDLKSTKFRQENYIEWKWKEEDGQTLQSGAQLDVSKLHWPEFINSFKSNIKCFKCLKSFNRPLTGSITTPKPEMSPDDPSWPT